MSKVGHADSRLGKLPPRLVVVHAEHVDVQPGRGVRKLQSHHSTRSFRRETTSGLSAETVTPRPTGRAPTEVGTSREIGTGSAIVSL